MEIEPWLPLPEQEELFLIVADILGDKDEIYIEDDSKLEIYLEKLSDIFPVNSIRVNRVLSKTFSEGPIIYLPLGDGEVNGVNFQSGDLIVIRSKEDSIFIADQDFYLLSFLASPLENLPDEVLANIISFLPNKDLGSLVLASKSVHFKPSDKEKILRRCGVYGKPVEYWNTFIKRTSRHPECYQYFLERGADIQADDNAALRLAAEYGNLEVVKFLVGQGADVQANNNYALRYAVLKGNLEMVRFLIENGADVRAVNNAVLRLAALRGYLGIIRFLVEKGANIQ